MKREDETLQMRRYPITEVSFGSEERYLDGRLTIAAEPLRRELLDARYFDTIDIDLVAPDKPARIINIIDVIEPRIKPRLSPPDYYPGLGIEPFPIGSGWTNVLSGMTIMTTALVEGAEDTAVSCEPGQTLRSRFAESWNLIVSPHPKAGVRVEEFTRAVYVAGCRAAVALARTTLGVEPEKMIELRCPGDSSAHPRIGYLCYLYSHGFGRQKFLYGRDSTGIAPTVIPVTHLLDGAVVDNGYTRPVRNSTYELANNAIAYELAAENGKDHTCPGLILVPHTPDLRSKASVAWLAARIARDVLRCDGVVISKDGGGQADVDVMQAVEACEALGMRTVAAVCEIAGEQGDMYPLVTTVKEADALVSLGNLTAPVALGKVPRVLGGSRFGRSSDDPYGPFTIPAAQVPGLIDMMGGTGVCAIVF